MSTAAVTGPIPLAASQDLHVPRHGCIRGDVRPDHAGKPACCKVRITGFSCPAVDSIFYKTAYSYSRNYLDKQLWGVQTQRRPRVGARRKYSFTLKRGSLLAAFKRKLECPSIFKLRYNKNIIANDLQMQWHDRNRTQIFVRV